MFTALPGLRSGHQQIGLTTQECWDLQDVDDVTGRSGLLGIMHVRQYGHIHGVSDLREDAQSFLQSRSAKAFQRRSVRFVVRGFEDVRHFQRAAHTGNRLGHLERVRPRSRSRKDRR